MMPKPRGHPVGKHIWIKTIALFSFFINLFIAMFPYKATKGIIKKWSKWIEILKKLVFALISETLNWLG